MENKEKNLTQISYKSEPDMKDGKLMNKNEIFISGDTEKIIWGLVKLIQKCAKMFEVDIPLLMLQITSILMDQEDQPNTDIVEHELHIKS